MDILACVQEVRLEMELESASTWRAQMKEVAAGEIRYSYVISRGTHSLFFLSLSQRESVYTYVYIYVYTIMYIHIDI